MEDCVIIVDNSNIWIEGMKLSAKLKHMPEPLDGKEACDYSWRIDFGKLLNVVAEGLTIRKAILVGSRPPKNDSLWNAAKIKGFEVIVQDRNSQNKEKAVDTKLVAKGVQTICTTGPAVLKVLSGDSDFLPLIEVANECGWETEIWAFTSALGSSSMPTSVMRIEPMDPHIKEIQYLPTN